MLSKNTVVVKVNFIRHAAILDKKYSLKTLTFSPREC